MLISVIIPAYNSAFYLPSLLQVVNAEMMVEHEIIVVDDGSSDDTIVIAQAYGATVLQTPQRQSGPATARNIGAKAAHGHILFFLDSDVLPHPDALQRVRDAFEIDDRLNAVFGSYDDQPTARNFLSQYKNLFHHYIHQHSNEESCTFWTGCGAIRRTVFEELGGFTIDYGRPCIEDIELGYRLSWQGGYIRLDKQLQVTHHKRWTLGKLLKTDIVDRGIPWTVLILRHRAFINDLNLETKNRISVVVLWLGLLSAITAILDIRFLETTFLLALLLLRMNWPLYRWFAEKRGWRFALKVVPFHWLYYGYNAISFAMGVLLYACSAFTREHVLPDHPGALAPEKN